MRIHIQNPHNDPLFDFSWDQWNAAAARAGATVMQPSKALDLKHERDGFVCMTTDGVITARNAIAANGSWERAPYPAAMPPHRASDLLAWRMFVEVASISRIGLRQGAPVMLGFNDTAHLG